MIHLVDAIESVVLDLVFAVRAAEVVRDNREDYSYRVEKEKAIKDVTKALLKDASLSDALNFSRLWHSTECRASTEKLRDLAGSGWAKCLTAPYTQAITIPDEKKKHTFELVDLNNLSLLKKEGNALNRCAGTNKAYRSNCNNGHVRILSVRDTAHPEQPLSTVEI